MRLPTEPVRFIWTVSLALTGREPCRSVAACLHPGDPLRLERERDNPHDPRAIRVINPVGKPAGYLYAAEAGLLHWLFDRYPPLADHSQVDQIIPAGHSRHSPIVRLRICLDLAAGWPLYTLVAMMELKEESFPRRFDFQLNPWLAPLLALHAEYQARPDTFHLPWPIARAWRHLTQPGDPEKRQRNEAPPCPSGPANDWPDPST